MKAVCQLAGNSIKLFSVRTSYWCRAVTSYWLPLATSYWVTEHLIGADLWKLTSYWLPIAAGFFKCQNLCWCLAMQADFLLLAASRNLLFCALTSYWCRAMKADSQLVSNCYELYFLHRRTQLYCSYFSCSPAFKQFMYMGLDASYTVYTVLKET